MQPEAFFSDSDYDANCAAIRTALSRIPQDGRILVVLPGIGTGLSELPRRAPRTYAFLQAALTALEEI